MTSNATSPAQDLATKTTTRRSAPPADAAATRRGTAASWIVGGALWMGAGLLYAETGWRFRASSATWLTADLLLVVGLIGLWGLRPHGHSRSASIALVVALVARMLFAAAEVSGLIAGTENEILLPAAALLTAVASIAYGASARSASRRLRTANIVMGLYFLVAMLPFVAVTGEPNSLAIAGWGIPVVLIGLTINHGPLLVSTRPTRVAA